MEWNRPSIDVLDIEETSNGTADMFAEGSQEVTSTNRNGETVTYIDYTHGYAKES